MVKHWMARGVAVALVGLVAAAATAPALRAQEKEMAPPRKEAFTAERFAQLQGEGALVLLDVFAPWCPTCAQQQKVLAEYRTRHPEVPLYTLTIDFDGQKEYVRRFGAPRQSTLILYKGTERVWFAVAETRADVITAELNRAAAAGRR
jgi:thioredoxin 1